MRITLRKPQFGTYVAHPKGTGPVDTAHELTWEDFVKLTTGQETFCAPPTLQRRDASQAVEEFSLPPVLREVLNLSGIHGVIEQHSDGTRGVDDELLLVLASLDLDSDLSAAALEDTRPKNKLRFRVTPMIQLCAALHDKRERKRSRNLLEKATKTHDYTSRALFSGPRVWLGSLKLWFQPQRKFKKEALFSDPTKWHGSLRRWLQRQWKFTRDPLFSGPTKWLGNLKQ